MRKILIANSKGGCGKSTIAVNLASYFACWGIRVAVVDCDRQRSVMDWLRSRPDTRPEIAGATAEDGGYRVPEYADYVIVDVPAGLHGKDLDRHLRRADAVIVPVLPSPLDIKASARFLAELLQADGLDGQTRVCAVANRVKDKTRSYRALEGFLARLAIPFVAKLRDTQNYVRAAHDGLGIFELPRREVMTDLNQWQPLVAWLSSDPRITAIPPIAAVEPDDPGLSPGTGASGSESAAG